MQWTNRRVLVTGGASFIGSHLVDALVARGAQVRVVDNLSSGMLTNLGEHVGRNVREAVEFCGSTLEVGRVLLVAAHR